MQIAKKKKKERDTCIVFSFATEFLAILVLCSGENALKVTLETAAS